jgi:glycine oxidase
VKTWDVAICGGGIVGLSLARELRKSGAAVLVVERGEPGREASHAAAGMLASCDIHLPPALTPLAVASALLYPNFVHELEDESGMRVDYRAQGALAFFPEPPHPPLPPCMRSLGGDEVHTLEPSLADIGRSGFFLDEASLDPRAFVAASVKAARHRQVDIASGSPVIEIEVVNGRASAVKTTHTRYPAGAIVNCCGAWAGTVPPISFPTRPIKGQMLALIPEHHGILKHVIRALPEVYLVPRSDGRVLVGSTLEDVGYDKRVDPNTIQRLHQAAASLLPELGQAKMLESWAGLRPGIQDDLPMLGATRIPGYFVAAGHYRDGILLAPITAQLMAQVVRGLSPALDLAAFSPTRF